MGEYLWVFLSFIGSVWVLGITQLWGIPGPICSRALQFCVEVAGAYSLMQTSISHLLQMIHLASKLAKYWVDQFATGVAASSGCRVRAVRLVLTRFKAEAQPCVTPSQPSSIK